MKRIIFCYMLIVVFSIGCSQPITPIPSDDTPAAVYSVCDNLPADRITEKAFKGIELYSYQNEGGAWVFSLLIGTNRTKYYEEVTGEAMTLVQLENCFCKLAIGEYVSWTNFSIRSSVDEEVHKLPNPPASLITEVENRADACEIDLWFHFD